MSSHTWVFHLLWMPGDKDGTGELSNSVVRIILWKSDLGEGGLCCLEGQNVGALDRQNQLLTQKLPQAKGSAERSACLKYMMHKVWAWCVISALVGTWCSHKSWCSCLINKPVALRLQEVYSNIAQFNLTLYRFYRLDYKCVSNIT